MTKFVLTLDYELYGNGSGNVFQHIIEPTERILQIVDKYNIRLTIFFEVIEYWRLKEEWESGNTMGYSQDPIAAMEEQLRAAYKAGHDIQLHLHPQWVDAKYEGNAWKVDLNNWRLGGYAKPGNDSLFNLLKRGKQTIEDIISDADYQCVAMRAGGYNVQPSSDISKAMQECGIAMDSSIYPGGQEMGMLSNYDYSMVPDNLSYWFAGEELEIISEENSGLLELPIVAFPIKRWEKYTSLERIRSLLQNKKSARDAFDAKTNGISKSKWDKIKFFFEDEYQTWDFCLFSPSMHEKYLSLIKKQDREVAVLVGHPKSFVGKRGFDYLLSKTVNKFEYNTISDLYATIFKEIN